MFSMLFFITASLLVTEHADTLSQATITADKGIIVSMSDTLSVRKDDDVSDLIMRMPGLTLSDYGSQAGLKTISMRGLGSAHTSIYIDGVRVSNMQSGQSDLGFLDMGTFDKAVVDYAQNSVSFETAKPVFRAGRNYSGKAAMRMGSWSSYSPELRLNYKFGNGVVSSLYSSAELSKGNFSYTDNYGKERVRENNDIRRYRIGADAFGTTHKGDWRLKAFYSQAERGVSGPLTLPSSDRQNDENAFLQAYMSTKYSRLFTMKSSAKFSLDNQEYAGEAQKGDYRHKEIQLNNAYIFNINDWWTVTLGSDLIWNGLKSDNYSGSQSRISVLNNLASSFHFERFRADFNVEQNRYHDKGQEALNVVAPAINLRLKALEGLDIVAYSRRSFRAPTYNELYYVGFGNKDLKPEDAWISDLGLEYHANMDWMRLSSKLDLYYAKSSNKIISAPDPKDYSGFLWKPYNVGKSDTKGIDLMADVQLGDGRIQGGVRALYSFVDSKDLNTGTALPYIAKHSASLSGELRIGKTSCVLDYNLRAGRRDAGGALKNFDTVDFSTNIPVRLAHSYNANIMMKVRNIFNSRYEMVSGYPMPGISFSGGVELEF